MKQSDLNKIYNMTIANKQSFKKNYPTAKSLADAIQQVFMAAALERMAKEDEARLEELRPLFTKQSQERKNEKKEN